MSDARQQTRQFGLLKLFGLQLALTPLLLGLGLWNSPGQFHNVFWGLLVLYALPPLYASLLAALIVPRDSASFSVKRRVAWGLMFGAIYGMSLILPEFISHTTNMVRRYDMLDRWDYRNMNVLIAILVLITAVSAALGGIAAGTWTALSPWAMHLFRKR